MCTTLIFLLCLKSKLFVSWWERQGMAQVTFSSSLSAQLVGLMKDFRVLSHWCTRGCTTNLIPVTLACLLPMWGWLFGPRKYGWQGLLRMKKTSGKPYPIEYTPDSQLRLGIFLMTLAVVISLLNADVKLGWNNCVREKNLWWAWNKWASN